MEKDMTQLFSNVTLKNGVTLNNRFAMAPMLVFAAKQDGTPSAADLAYFERRNQVGQLLITGATTISKQIKCAPGQLSLASEEAVGAFSELAKVMKKHGNKAILQIQHPGREAAVGYVESGYVVAPSSIDFPFLKYVPKELTDEEINVIIKNFGETTKRAIRAGFDGVEIHGANHYLIQQFFSSYSNHRTDFWGGTLERRMNFPLAVLKEVNRVVEEMEASNFIVGYRLSPEEVHGDNVGYVIDETLVLVDRLVAEGIDYLHTSTFGGGFFGEEAYKLKALAGDQSKPINTLISEVIDQRVPLIVCGSINSPETALDALNYGDIIGMGVAALADPDFALKIAGNRENKIEMDVSEKQEELALPENLVKIYREGTSLPPIKGLN